MDLRTTELSSEEFKHRERSKKGEKRERWNEEKTDAGSRATSTFCSVLRHFHRRLFGLGERRVLV